MLGCAEACLSPVVQRNKVMLGSVSRPFRHTGQPIDLVPASWLLREAFFPSGEPAWSVLGTG
jgi:hypothetical protein